MSDIAEKLGVSKNSVSLTLNNKSGVGEDLRRKIIDTAKQMNYGKYSATENDKSNCIVLIVPEYLRNDNFFYFDVLWAIEKEAKEEICMSIITSVSQSAEQELTLPSLPQDMNIIGLLVIGILSEVYIQKLYQLKYPIVTVDISYYTVPVTSICSSNLTGGYIATKYLIEAGHQEIGFIGPIYSAQSVYERWCGFSQALSHHELPINPKHNIIGEYGVFQLFDTIEVLEPYLDHFSTFPTAWFCAGDRIAATLMSLLTKRGLKIPDDISIVGFDDIALSQMIIPPLTTIHVDRKRMGQVAVQQLIQNYNNNIKDVVLHMTLPCNLVVRNSVKHL